MIAFSKHQHPPPQKKEKKINKNWTKLYQTQTLLVLSGCIYIIYMYQYLFIDN